LSSIFIDFTMDFVVITKREFDGILRNREKGFFSLRVDFGLKEVKVEIREEKAILDGRFVLDLRNRLKPHFCYLLKKNKILPIAFFSKDTNRFYKLIPTKDWPSLAIGSVPMHKVKLSSPYQDTKEKIELLRPWGRVLDTCMGLGYTAILASPYSKEVITFEKDKNVLFLTKINPLSYQIFLDPKIKVKKADITKYIHRFPLGYFDCVICDPPTFKLAPSLYSVDFYYQLYRVLRKKGRLYHYLPLYRITQGYNFPSKIKRKLEEVGFRTKRFLPSKGHLLCIK